MSTGASSPQYVQGNEELRGTRTPDGARKPRTCKYCDREYTDGYDDDYCRERCRYNGIAYDALRRLRHDHTYCISCFRRLKTFAPPGRNHIESPSKTDLLSHPLPEYGPPDHPRAISVGGLVPREKAEPGYQWDVGELFAADPLHGDWSFIPRGMSETKVCQCGVAHHATVGYGDDETDGGGNFRLELAATEANRCAERLADVLDDRIENGDWDHDYDREAFIEDVWEMKTHPEISGRGKDFMIFEWALGFAIRRAD